MTWPQKESPTVGGRDLDHVGRGDLNTIYGSKEESATADVAIGHRQCHSCAAFYAYDNGQGECRRYAPRPNFDHTLSVEWPRVVSGDFCLEYVSKGGE